MKKRIISCIFAVLAAVTATAKDVIVTTDAKTIDAKIKEVSKTEIMYKEIDNLDGPDFILPISDISTITYSNGKVVSYNALPQTEQQVTEQQITQSEPTPQNSANIATILLLSGHTLTGEIVEMNSKYAAFLNEKGARTTVPASQIISVSLPNGQVKIYNEDTSKSSVSSSSTLSTPSSISAVSSPYSTHETSIERIERDGKSYRYKGKYISKEDVANILKSNDNLAYSEWKKGRGMEISGDVFLGIASGFAVSGLIIELISGNMVAGLSMEGIAAASLGVGLGLVLSAPKNYNHAVDIYNSKYDHASMQFRWSVAPTGVGMAITF